MPHRHPLVSELAVGPGPSGGGKGGKETGEQLHKAELGIGQRRTWWREVRWVGGGCAGDVAALAPRNLVSVALLLLVWLLVVGVVVS